MTDQFRVRAGTEASERRAHDSIVTNGPDMLYKRPGNGTSDTIYGRRGGDVLPAYEHTRDADHLDGNCCKDELNVNDGDTRDTVSGGPRFDICIVDSRGELDGGCEAVRVKQLTTSNLVGWPQHHATLSGQ